MSLPTMSVTMIKDYFHFKKGEKVSVPVDQVGLLVNLGAASTGRPETDAIIQNDPDAVARNRPRKSFADFLNAVRRRDTRYLSYHYGSKLVLANDSDGDSEVLHQRRKAAMAESSGITGGYTVPGEFTAEIMGQVNELAILRPLLDDVGGVLPMTTATLQVPTPDITTARATGVSPFFGGMQFYWTQEGIARTDSEPALKQTELRAWELSATVTISRALADDSPALARYLTRMFSEGIAEAEEYAFFQGNGVAKPQGIISAGATLPVVRQTPGTITYLDAATMIRSLVPGSMCRASWIASPTALPSLLQLQDGNGRAALIPAGLPFTDKQPCREWTLAGLPLYVSEKLSPLGTKGDLILIDPRFYLIGERTEVLVSVSHHVKMLSNQLVYRVVRRVDGQPLFDKTITLQDGQTAVSGLVVLV